MQSTRALVEAASKSILQIDERYEGYRADLVHRLAVLIQTQDERGTPTGRREQIDKEVNAIAEKLIQQTYSSGAIS